MKKSVFLSAALFISAVPFSVNATTTNIDLVDNLESDESQVIIAGIFDTIKDIEETTSDSVDNVKEAEENVNSINDNAGEAESMVSGGEDVESDEVVEETEIEEGTEAVETEEVSDESF